MKKPLLIVTLVLGLLIAGSFVFLLMQASEDNDSIDNSVTATVTESTPTPSSTPTPAGQVAPGAYKDYDAEVVASTSGTKVLFFHAPWCPQCRQLDSEIRKGTLPDNTTIFKVDYDTNQSLRQKYGVTLQTTLVKVDDQGNLVAKYVAYEDPTLDSIKQNIL